MLLAPLVPLWQLASWSAVVAAVACAVAFRRLSKRHRTAVTGSLKDVRETVLDGISLGAIWSIPPLAFGQAADSDAMLGLWVVLSLLMTASAVAMAALPLATLLGMAAAMVLVAYLLSRPRMVRARAKASNT